MSTHFPTSLSTSVTFSDGAVRPEYNLPAKKHPGKINEQMTIMALESKQRSIVILGVWEILLFI